MSWSLSSLFSGLNDPAYLHVLLNHLPLTGLAVAVVLLVVSPLTFSRRTMLLMMLGVAVLCFSAYPAAMFGEQAYEPIKQAADAKGQQWLEHHASLANTWKWLYYGTGLVAVIGFVVGLFKVKSLWLTLPLVVVLSGASLWQGARIADAGGMVRHAEFRKHTELPAHPHEGDHESKENHNGGSENSASENNHDQDEHGQTEEADKSKDSDSNSNRDRSNANNGGGSIFDF